MSTLRSLMHTSKSKVSRRPDCNEYYWYYVCSNSKYNSFNRCPNGHSIREDVIDNYVAILVPELVKNEEFMP